MADARTHARTHSHLDWSRQHIQKQKSTSSPKQLFIQKTHWRGGNGDGTAVAWTRAQIDSNMWTWQKYIFNIAACYCSVYPFLCAYSQAGWLPARLSDCLAGGSTGAVSVYRDEQPWRCGASAKHCKVSPKWAICDVTSIISKASQRCNKTDPENVLFCWCGSERQREVERTKNDATADDVAYVE